jgi:hypothetical protein
MDVRVAANIYQKGKPDMLVVWDLYCKKTGNFQWI